MKIRRKDNKYETDIIDRMTEKEVIFSLLNNPDYAKSSSTIQKLQKENSEHTPYRAVK